MRKKYLIIILITFILCINSCSKSSSNLEKYLKSGTPIDSKAKDVMPTLQDLPKYQNVVYQYTHKSIILFESDSVALVVNYDDETYKREKDKLAEKYIFLDKKVGFNNEEGRAIIPEYKFSINSYNFRVVEESGKQRAEFPKFFGIIGTSEEKKSIAYLYFYDTDLDCIGEKDDNNPMASFVKEYFEYEF